MAQSVGGWIVPLELDELDLLDELDELDLLDEDDVVGWELDALDSDEDDVVGWELNALDPDEELLGPPEADLDTPSDDPGADEAPPPPPCSVRR